MNKEELDLLENVFTLAIGECAYNDINDIQKLEYKIKTINNLCKKQKEVIDKTTDYVELEKINDMIIKFNRDLLKENINLKKIEKEHKKINGELREENQKYKEVIDKANNKLNSFIECCKVEKLESGSDYLHHQYWDMFERFNKQIKDILKEVK